MISLPRVQFETEINSGCDSPLRNSTGSVLGLSLCSFASFSTISLAKFPQIRGMTGKYRAYASESCVILNLEMTVGKKHPISSRSREEQDGAETRRVFREYVRLQGHLSRCHKVWGQLRQNRDPGSCAALSFTPVLLCTTIFKHRHSGHLHYFVSDFVTEHLKATIKSDSIRQYRSSILTFVGRERTESVAAGGSTFAAAPYCR
jgi:hypothetical protein